MSHAPLPVRAKLTLLYTALFGGGALVLVALTYALVSASTTVPLTAKPARVSSALAQACSKVAKDPNSPVNLRAKCQDAVKQGFLTGAQTQREATLSHLLLDSMVTLGAVTIVAALAGWFLAGRLLRPLHQITATAREASERNLGQRLSLRGPRDELRQLADTFDDMLARLDAAFTSQQRFIANASHELRTPLTLIRTTLDVVLAKPAPSAAELSAMGAGVRRAVQHAESIIEALLTLARNDNQGLRVHDHVDLATAAEDVLDALQHNGIRVEARLQPAAVKGDPVLLERLVANLVDNAVRHNVPGGVARVETATVDGLAHLTVANTGPIVPVASLPTILEPFQRIQERTGSDGVGLGLALVASITEVHQGHLVTTANPGGGLTIHVTLPASQSTGGND